MGGASALFSLDPGGFNNIFEKYWEPLYSYAFKILGDHDSAQDIVQDLFAHLWRKRQELSITTSMEAYLFKAVKYRIYSQIRANTRRSHHYMEIVKDVERVEQYEKIVERKEVSSLLYQAINQLPRKMKQIFELYLHGLNIKEIAQLLSLSEQTVRNQINIASKKLHQELGDVDPSAWAQLSCLFLILSNC